MVEGVFDSSSVFCKYPAQIRQSKVQPAISPAMLGGTWDMAFIPHFRALVSTQYNELAWPDTCSFHLTVESAFVVCPPAQGLMTSRAKALAVPSWIFSTEVSSRYQSPPYIPPLNAIIHSSIPPTAQLATKPFAIGTTVPFPFSERPRRHTGPNVRCASPWYSTETFARAYVCKG